MKTKNNTFKAVISAVLCLAIMSSFASCGKNIASATKSDKEIVMKVGEYEVRRDLCEYFRKNFEIQYGLTSDVLDKLGDSEKEAAYSKLDESTVNSVKKLYSIYLLASENGISPDDEELSSRVDDYVSSVINSEYDGSEKELRRDLEEQNMTYDTFLKTVEATELQNMLYMKLISDGKIEQNADVLTDAFLNSEMVRTKHILVNYPDTLTPNDIVNDYADAKEKIADKVEKIVSEIKDGKDFDLLIDKYNNDALMMKNTDGSYFTKGNKDLSYEITAFSLEIGEISDVIYTSEGACIIKRLELSEDYIEKNLYSLIESYSEGIFNIMLEDAAERLEVSTVAN